MKDINTATDEQALTRHRSHIRKQAKTVKIINHTPLQITDYKSLLEFKAQLAQKLLNTSRSMEVETNKFSKQH